MFKKIYYSKWFPRFFYLKNDGGAESGVTGYMLIEWKCLLSLGVIHFKEGSRESYHTHAFNAISWWLKGSVTEQHEGDAKDRYFSASLKPKITKRSCFHRVVAHCDTYALTFRGPWQDTWKESRKGQEVTLTHGRKVVQ